MGIIGIRRCEKWSSNKQNKPMKRAHASTDSAKEIKIIGLRQQDKSIGQSQFTKLSFLILEKLNN